MREEKRGRPTKEDECRFVKTSEVVTSFDEDSRLLLALEEMGRFLQSSGKKGRTLTDDIADLNVFLPFVLSRLWAIPVNDIVGTWLVNEAWDRTARWERLCDRWQKRWETLRDPKIAPSFMSGWRMACMVAAWQLLDESVLASEGMPSVEEISGAAVMWLNERGVSTRAMATIENKTKREFERIALDWLPRGGLNKIPPPLFPDCFQKYVDGVTAQPYCEEGYEPFSWLPTRREDLEEFAKMRIEMLNFLRRSDSKTE